MDPKISFRQRENAEYPDAAAVSGLLHAYHTASSGMCLKKQIAPRVALGSLWIPPVDHQRNDTRQK